MDYSSTDASVYRELPLAVVWPRSAADRKKVLALQPAKNKHCEKPAGTSLAGQVVVPES